MACLVQSVQSSLCCLSQQRINLLEQRVNCLCAHDSILFTSVSAWFENAQQSWTQPETVRPTRETACSNPKSTSKRTNERARPFGGGWWWVCRRYPAERGSNCCMQGMMVRGATLASPNRGSEHLSRVPVVHPLPEPGMIDGSVPSLPPTCIAYPENPRVDFNS